MAVYDSAVLPFKMDAVVVKLTDGTPITPLTMTLYLLQGSKITYTDPGPVRVGVKNGGRYLSTPTVVDTGDQDITGSVVFLVTSFVGDAAYTPFEFMKGTIASFVSRGNGGSPQVQIDVDYINTEDDSSGVTQTGVIDYATFDNFAVDPAGTDTLVTITADFTARIRGSRVAYT